MDGVIASDWWADRWPWVGGVAVGRSRSRRFAGYAVNDDDGANIRLATLSEPVVLHELRGRLSAETGSQAGR